MQREVHEQYLQHWRALDVILAARAKIVRRHIAGSAGFFIIVFFTPILPANLGIFLISRLALLGEVVLALFTVNRLHREIVASYAEIAAMMPLEEQLTPIAGEGVYHRERRQLAPWQRTGYQLDMALPLITILLIPFGYFILSVSHH